MIDTTTEKNHMIAEDLILASGSPRRKNLLGSIGLSFRVIPSDVEENRVPGETPEEHVLRLADAKARNVAERHPNAWVLGADTIVVIDDDILEKPDDRNHAKMMLSMLSGRIHRVFTGYALVNVERPDKARTGLVVSDVRIRDMSDSEIDRYIRTGEPMDKAGAYAVQGIGAAIVERISGSYTNVVGLPLCEVCLDLKDLGIHDFLNGRPEK